jgi:thiamine-monophosphate kinase
MADEFDFLQWIKDRQRAVPRTSESARMVQLGSGDDLAVLRWPGSELLLAGVDQVLDGVHVDSTIHSPQAIGRKAMNRNLSDCAAMACLPAAALATVALPRGVGLDYAKDLYLGMEEAAEPFDCPIVGGDTASWPGKLLVTVTIFGRSAGIEPITRRAAKAGDFVYVTGPLGGSLLGRHMTFSPRVTLARDLAEQYRPSTMIDLSDGLSRDLGHICRQSQVGAVIDAQVVPIHDDAVRMAKDGRTPLEHALHDGEDYELLLTCSHEIPGLHRVGVVTGDPGVYLRHGENVELLEPQAWEHKL